MSCLCPSEFSNRILCWQWKVVTFFLVKAFKNIPMCNQMLFLKNWLSLCHVNDFVLISQRGSWNVGVVIIISFSLISVPLPVLRYVQVFRTVFLQTLNYNLSEFSFSTFYSLIFQNMFMEFLLCNSQKWCSGLGI